MDTHYPKRALEILRERGPVELSKSVIRFFTGEIQESAENAKRNFRWRRNQAKLMNVYSLGSLPKKSRTYSINPNEIKYLIWWGQIRKHFGGRIPEGPVWKGEWDKSKIKFENQHVYPSFVNRFKHGQPWSETEYYSHLIDNKGYERPGAIKYLEQYEELFYDINSNGYDDEFPIIVHIDRNGEFIRHDGNHRLSIAKIVGVDSIPIKVHAIHKQWQELRHEIYNNGLPKSREDLCDHPDLQDILN